MGINDAEFTREGPSTYDGGRVGNARTVLKRLHIVQRGLWIADALGNLSGRSPNYAGHRRLPVRAADYAIAELTADTPALAARNAESFRLRVRRLLSDAREYGAEVVCVSQPHRLVRNLGGTRRGIAQAFGWDGSEYRYGGLDFDYSLRLLNRIMLEECGTARFVDLYHAPFGDGDFYDHIHTTPAGSRKVGRYLARFIADSDLINRLRE